MEKTEVITDEPTETIVINWDGIRFILTRTARFQSHRSKTVIILNPREMSDLIHFVRTLGKGG